MIEPDSRSGAGMFTSATIIAFAMASGVILFSIFALFRNDGAGTWEPTIFDYAWAGFALMCFGMSRFFWRRKVAPLLPRGFRQTSPGDDSPSLLAGLVTAWAPLEAAALAGLVLYFLFGSLYGLVGGLSIMLVGLLLTRPRRSWFTAPDGTDPLDRAAAGS